MGFPDSCCLLSIMRCSILTLSLTKDLSDTSGFADARSRSVSSSYRFLDIQVIYNSLSLPLSLAFVFLAYPNPRLFPKPLTHFPELPYFLVRICGSSSSVL